METKKKELDLNSFNPDELQYIPEKLALEQTELVFGIDEAGRGPLLGPMLYGCCFGPISEMKTVLSKMGFNDSKKLTETERETLFNKMKDHPSIGWIALSLEPENLSEKMLRINKVSLNTISHDAAIHLLRKATQTLNLNVKKVFVDTVGTPSKYQSKLSSLFPEMEITVSKKADSKYPIVGGASIVAKVIRDHRLKFWKFKEDINVDKNYGSGYPSDPLTQAWLKRNIDPVFGSPSLVRFSWRPSVEILSKTALGVCWSLDEDENEDRETKVKRVAITKIKDRGIRYRYFAENNMELVEEGML